MNSRPPLPTSDEPCSSAIGLLAVRLALWLPVAAVIGVLVGGASAEVQRWFAPLVFFPLLVGIVLGGLLVGAMRWLNLGNIACIAAGVLVAVAVTVVAQHYTAYWMARHPDEATRERLEKAAVAFPERAAAIAAEMPQSFSAYLQREALRGRPLWQGLVARGAWAWVSWAVDALLVLLAATALIVPAARLPYCRHCRSWYRTVRSARVRPAVALQLAKAVGLSLQAKVTAARYRLLGCDSGCGPTGLELIWREKKTDHDSSLVWLTADQRNAVTTILDDARRHRHDDDPPIGS